ncbi:MAG: DUF1329 domain-containing protein [Deltaproteobacteria bacterium]|nr:DUF1329 domain-containing protein [Deltaproteobacteria bacterium]
MVRKAVVVVAFIMASAVSSWGAATPQELDRLGKDLNFAGAEKAGNKEGTIPAWEGKDVPLAGWSVGKYRGEYWKFKDEKPLFSIDASNVDKYKDKLSPGQVQWIKQTKGYRMDVYPSHRNAGYPDWIEANIRKNATGAKVAKGGDQLAEAYLPGIPFPFPKSGAEIIWNFLTRYKGVGNEFPRTTTAVSPRPGSTEWLDPAGPQHTFYPWGRKGTTTLSQTNGLLYCIDFGYDTPAALAGQRIMICDSTRKPRESFFYFPGQRRVRRLPSYAYDAPQIGFENQYPIDTAWVYMSIPDRYDWKILGKKEMYVPYNSFGMYDFRKKLHDVLQNKFLANESRRYELHRVWVVEGNVKKGMRHSMPKRVFYFDEDTYLALIGDQYDANGALWKMEEGYPIPIWELGGTIDHFPFVMYDLVTGRYVCDQSAIGTGKDMRYHAESTHPKFKADWFTAENLRAVSER